MHCHSVNVHGPYKNTCEWTWMESRLYEPYWRCDAISWAFDKLVDHTDEVREKDEAFASSMASSVVLNVAMTITKDVGHDEKLNEIISSVLYLARKILLPIMTYQV